MLFNIMYSTSYRSVAPISFIFLGLVLSSCSGGSDSSNEVTPNPSGSMRVASVDTVTTDGDTFALSYTYDSAGRLISSNLLSNGVQSLSRTYSYSEDGKVSTRVTDNVDEDERDTLREYVYSGNDLSGYYSSFIGELTDAVLQYQRSSGRIVSYEQRTIDPAVESPTLSMGELFRTVAYTYNDLGFIARTVTRDADGNVVRQSDYDVANNGQRLSHQSYDGDANLLSTTTWNYENASCVEFPWSITQYICVQ